MDLKIHPWNKVSTDLGSPDVNFRIALEPWDEYWILCPEGNTGQSGN